MVLTGFSGLIASLLYLYASSVLWKCIRQCDEAYLRSRLLKIIILAASFHFFAFASVLFEPAHITFSLGIALSVISWSAVLLLLMSNLTKHTEMLGSFILPFALLTTLLPVMDPNQTTLAYALGTHVVLSVLAYSLLGLAAAQGWLYSIQEKRFRKKQLSNLLRAMPPLQVMEKTLIELVITGFIFLSLALLSGLFFLEDLFAQHLVHKTFFAILAWLTYAVFLIGHFKLGWRGQKATHYTVWAFALLLMSYLGTQVIMTFILN